MLILVPISASSPSSGISTQDFHSIGDVNGEVLVNSDYNIRSKRQKHRYKSHVSWINGIAHTPSDAKETAERMSSLFGGETIHYCHNPTSMTKPSDTLGYVRDLTQCTQQLRFGKETQEVLDLTNHLRELCRKTGRYGRVLHLAHSQGALITYLAAKKLTEEERRKIEIVCFGGAAAITVEEFPEFSRCVNYYSVNDPLLHIVDRSKRALSTGLLSLHPTTGEPSFVFLTPKGNDPIIDHGLLGPTYKEMVEWEGRRFRGTYWGGRVRGFDELVRVRRAVDLVVRWMAEAILKVVRKVVEARGMAGEFIKGIVKGKEREGGARVTELHVEGS